MTIDTKTTHRTGARGNVFLDLGFSPREAKRLLAQTDAQIDESIRLKQQLMDEIARWIREACVTQAVAAEVLHVTRPRVSDVVNHKVSKFTIDALVAMLARIGKQVRLAAIEASPRYPGIAPAGRGGIVREGGVSTIPRRTRATSAANR